jgi:hypothetical protein
LNGEGSSSGFCVQWDGPEAGFVDNTAADDLCESELLLDADCNYYSLGATSDFHLLVGIRGSSGAVLPDGGSVFTFFTSQAGCGGPPQFCSGGCNGAGNETMR